MTKDIYYHTGLSKTGSTFLQHQFFPKIEGVHYLPTVQYRRALQLIPNLNHQKLIISREFDQQFEIEIKKFAAEYPQAKPIVVFREPGSWAVSNYKRFVKNGHPITFKEFIDLDKDLGIFKIKDFQYTRYVQLLEDSFEAKPLVLLYEDLKSNPVLFLENLARYMDIRLDLKAINLAPQHVSYDENSLKLVRRLSKHIPFQKKLEVHRKPIGFAYNLYANLFRYSILYGAKLIPNAWFPKEIFIQPQEIEAVSVRFKKEWDFIKEKAVKIH